MMMIPQQGAQLSTAAQWLTDSLWQEFVSTVLDIVIESYEKMAERSTYEWFKWAEGTFSANLRCHMNEIRRQRDLGWYIGLEGPTVTPEILSGQKDLKEADRQDIYISDTNSRRQDYFVFECKLISDQYKIRSRNLTKAYVVDGMTRFIVNEEYSADLPESGMIGYVLSGLHSKIVGQINEHVTRVLSLNDCLQTGQPQREFEAFYCSNHVRHQSQAALKLYHLFLAFDFSQPDSSAMLSSSTSSQKTQSDKKRQKDSIHDRQKNTA